VFSILSGPRPSCLIASEQETHQRYQRMRKEFAEGILAASDAPRARPPHSTCTGLSSQRLGGNSAAARFKAEDRCDSKAHLGRSLLSCISSLERHQTEVADAVVDAQWHSTVGQADPH